MRLFLAALTVLVPFFFIHYGQREHVRLDRLAAEGKQTSGTITGKTSGRRSSRTLRYEYRVDAATYTGSESVSNSEYNARAIGSDVTVTYLPVDPKVHEYGTVKPGDGASKESTLSIIGAIGGIALLVGVMAMQRSIGRDRRLCEYGLAAQGAVTDQTRGKHPRTHYVFTPRGGQPIQGSSQTTLATRKLAPGEALVVLYDPQNPSINKPHKAIALARVAGAR